MATLTTSYEPFTTTVDPMDTKFDDYTIGEVETQEDGSGWFVTSTESWTCFVPRLTDDTPEPHVGDHLRLYGGLGFEIQGQALNGRVLWYRERDTLDARYEALPAPFKARIDRFRAESPDFRVDSEGYETFTLQQAALLAEHFQTEDAVLAWKNIESYDEQMQLAPEGWSDQHSDNTHGMAVRYAIALIRGEDV